MTIRRSSGLLSLLVFLSISSITHAKEFPLKLSEVSDLFVGNTLTLTHNGRSTLQYTDRNGDVTQEIRSGDSKTGNWEISGARNPRICYDFPTDNKIKCFAVRRDELSETYIIYRYRNKRIDKEVFRVTNIENGNQLASYAPPQSQSVYLSRSTVRQVQAALNKRGFRAGSVDGAMGNQTRNAIADYQRFIGQSETGKLTQDQLDRLLN